jgi:uncharacterized protein
LRSTACQVQWTDPERFETVAAFLIKHRDHKWSFTDCLSFVVMKKLRVTDALTKNVHFQQAGFVPLLRS